MPRQKPDSPHITAFLPPTQECPTIKLTEIKTQEIDNLCARNVVEEILYEKIPQIHDPTIDFITTPVVLEIKHRTKSKTYEWDMREFPCISTFFDDLRPRLNFINAPELSKIISGHVEAIIKQVRNTCVRTTKRTFEEPRMPSEADLVITKLRDTLGLEGLRAPSRRVANLSRRKLGRWTDPDTKSIVKLARTVKEIVELMELLK